MPRKRGAAAHDRRREHRFARTANGNVAPIRKIVGAATGLDCAGGVFADTTTGHLIVASLGNNAINTYARTANGNIAPLSVITGGATGLSQPGFLDVGTAGVGPPPPPPPPPPVLTQPIPTLSEWSLIALLVLLASVAVRRLRRR